MQKFLLNAFFSVLFVCLFSFSLHAERPIDSKRPNCATCKIHIYNESGFPLVLKILSSRVWKRKGITISPEIPKDSHLFYKRVVPLAQQMGKALYLQDFDLKNDNLLVAMQSDQTNANKYVSLSPEVRSGIIQKVKECKKDECVIIIKVKTLYIRGKLGKSYPTLFLTTKNNTPVVINSCHEIVDTCEQDLSIYSQYDSTYWQDITADRVQLFLDTKKNHRFLRHFRTFPKDYSHPFVSKIFRYTKPGALQKVEPDLVCVYLPGTWGRTISIEAVEQGTSYVSALERFAYYLLKNTETRMQKNINSIELVLFEWSGYNTSNERLIAAFALHELLSGHYPESMICTLAHSHGGNVVNIASNIMQRPIEQAFHVFVPSRQGSDQQWYEPNFHVIKNLYSFYTPADLVQYAGSIIPAFKYPQLYGGRKFFNDKNSVYNVRVQYDAMGPGHTDKMPLYQHLPEVCSFINKFKVHRDLNINITLSSNKTIPRLMVGVLDYQYPCKNLLTDEQKHQEDYIIETSQDMFERTLSDESESIFKEYYAEDMHANTFARNIPNDIVECAKYMWQETKESVYLSLLSLRKKMRCYISSLKHSDEKPK